MALQAEAGRDPAAFIRANTAVEVPPLTPEIRLWLANEAIPLWEAGEAELAATGLPPPFFRALTHYAADGSYSWHCPGHSGGVAFLKSPVGQMFHQFFGENMLRADVCNAVDELGQLLDHTGPVAASERNAARIFHCDHLYFVTNGPST